MRNALGSILASLVPNLPRVNVFCGDIGYGVFDELRRIAPERFHNFGISEQHMVSFAAAYAYESDSTNFVYTINPFITSRVHDQLRVDVAYSKSPLVVCSVGAGFAYDNLGFTHFGIEDLSLIQVLPNFRIFTPCDPDDVVNVVRSLLSERPLLSPSYIRLQKGGEKNLNNQFSGYEHCRSYKLWRGTDLLVITHGAITEEVLKAREILKDSFSIEVHSVIDWHSYIKNENLCVPNIVFVEEHRIVGSLAQTLIANLVQSGKVLEKVKCLHVSKAEFDICISREIALQMNSLDSKSISEEIRTLLK